MSEDFLKVSPNNRIPAIVDTDGPDGKEISIFETGAILIYLADKTGRFLPRELRARSNVIQWVMWQMGGLGPMLGQHGHFALYAAEKIPYAIERYRDEGFAGLCETLTDLDEGLQEWRYRHVMMVRRTIGTKMGTGGSDGAAYLATTLFRPAFPDLWAIRTAF